MVTAEEKRRPLLELYKRYTRAISINIHYLSLTKPCNVSNTGY
nr:MAG TPA: hypothetical protein [Caudoviricetes sp.]